MATAPRSRRSRLSGAVDLSLDTVLTTSDGRSATVEQWLKITGLSQNALRHRFSAGKSIDEALIPMSEKPKVKDMTHRVFGRLRVLGRAVVPNSNAACWQCLCDPDLGGCGTVRPIRGNSLRSGQIKSCGCLRRERLVSPEATEPYTVARLKAEGMRRFNAWVHQEDYAELRRIATEMRRKRRLSPAPTRGEIK